MEAIYAMNGNEPIINRKETYKLSVSFFIVLVLGITFALAGGSFNLTKYTYVQSKGILSALGEFVKKIIN